MYTSSLLFLSSKIRVVEFLSEVDLLVSLIGHNGFLARLPVSRAHFSMLIRELKGLNQSQCLIHRPSDRVIIDLHGAKLAITIDNENAT